MARYTLLEKLGEGGMGAVYRAVQKRLEREVALRPLPRGASRDPKAHARFNREISLELPARLRHKLPRCRDADDKRGASG